MSREQLLRSGTCALTLALLSAAASLTAQEAAPQPQRNPVGTVQGQQFQTQYVRLGQPVSAR